MAETTSQMQMDTTPAALPSRSPTPTALISPPTPTSGTSTPDMPGTPTSTTTSLSTLSTTAIKDGHRGTHPPTQDAERDDRISRLTGMSSLRHPGPRVLSTVGSASATSAGGGRGGEDTGSVGGSAAGERGDGDESGVESAMGEGTLSLAGSQEGAGREAERIVRRLDGGDAEPAGGRALGSPEGEGLGRFYFEDKR
ncbi:hypothetical protein VE03_01403 [Pseudogymnoascus sp. 23342-1-I1]|nr:hypothetical protein VE03_01403 [Pseudogymnoascus sp. 23342-1-I1]